jgi:ribosomal protein S18 acetylase RimI-like enzyme
MSESAFMPDIKLLVPDEWPLLRDIRLAALGDSPHAFLSSHQVESAFDELRWRAEFERGEWTVSIHGDQPTGIVGCTREPGKPAYECYLEYIWVAPEWRNQGVAHNMLTVVLGRLRESGVRTAYLWVLDGNDAAVRLYKRVGFISSDQRQPLAERPGRSEELMQFNLGPP